MAMTEQQIQLVIAAQSGDTKSFEQLYTVYYKKVYGFARMILKNERDAEDVLQETFLTAWRKLDTLESPPAFSVWIQIIAKNLCNAQLRRKNLVILLDAEQDIETIDTEESEETLPAVYAERADLKDRLGRIIDSLSDVQRQTIALYYFNELSVDEIADVMACSPGTVKSRLYLARKTIKAEVEEQERKSGEKFYGVIGLPLLPLGRLIQSHIESMALDQSAANATLDAISHSISETNTIQSKKTEGGKMSKKLSMQTKILAGAAAVVIVAAAVVLAVFLTRGDKLTGGQEMPEPLPLFTLDPIIVAEPTFTPLAALPTPEPAPTETTTPTATPKAETSYAYITSWGETMTVYKDFAFDYVDWLTGEEAIVKYMADHGVSRAVAEDETQEAGYIRNVNPLIRWFSTTKDTVYYLPDATLVNKKADNEAFKNRMIPAIENGETWLTFVKVTVSGDKIVKIEWAYRP
ncbi:MAG: RNA polymerase sigma factor [Clostridiales bacterium]|nr:RNA polymerase sigma factor [Clostridiales bacterium]